MENEAARIRKLYQMELLDTPAERDFDEIVQLASQVARTPISLITLLDTDRQWFKARVGMDATDTDRPSAVCNYTIQSDTLFEVEDLLADRRFEQNKLVKSGPKLRYYAGMPLITSDGHRLGALCVIDTKSRNKLTQDQAFALTVLARQAMNQIELRVKNRELATVKAITDRLVQAVGSEFELMTTRLRETLSHIDPEADYAASLAREIMALQRTMNLADRSFANVISWGRLQTVPIKGRPSTTRLAETAADCVETIALAAEGKGNTITIDIHPDAMMEVPPDTICFIIRNLLDNANKYTSDGQITLRHFTSGSSQTASARQYICVEDSGIGLPDEALQDFKEGKELPLRPGTHGEPGHGHGLMLVKHVLHYLGGKMHIEAVAGGHCSVIVII